MFIYFYFDFNNLITMLLSQVKFFISATNKNRNFKTSNIKRLRKTYFRLTYIKLSVKDN